MLVGISKLLSLRRLIARQSRGLDQFEHRNAPSLGVEPLNYMNGESLTVDRKSAQLNEGMDMDSGEEGRRCNFSAGASPSYLWEIRSIHGGQFTIQAHWYCLL